MIGALLVAMLAYAVAGPYLAINGIAPGERPKAVDPLQNATTNFESTSLFTATVETADGKPLVFEFTRTGLAWKLTGLRLPD
ncbi:MAG: hypothetical protein IPF45_04325 [Thermomonas sp.]|nr:hypothetical protein [Thermomonas sp.]